MYQEASPQPRKSLAPLFIILGVIFVIFVAIVGLLGFGVYKVATTGMTNVRSVSDVFVRDYTTGNGSAAYSLMTSSEQSATSPTRMTAAGKFLINQNGPVSGQPLVINWNMNNFNGVSYATLKYTIPYKSKPSEMTVQLIKNQTWQVQSYNVQME